MLRGWGQSGDHSEERAELFRMDPVQAGEGWAGRAKAGLQSATVRCLAASITARPLRTLGRYQKRSYVRGVRTLKLNP